MCRQKEWIGSKTKETQVGGARSLQGYRLQEQSEEPSITSGTRVFLWGRMWLGCK